ncbi:MAG: prepilin-type N-terminal cleavage/methylation domain-containing protein [Blastochloris sp.]|nr:prepilin-type N-terminal cleavage/methylation domain-containing protein [Blastochloris sp.]
MSGRPCRKRGDDGFTLIEVVVALAVVALGLASIGALIATTNVGARTLEQKVALVEAARLIATSLSLESGPGFAAGLRPSSGEVAGLRWEAREFPFTGDDVVVPDSPWAPYRVLLRVRSPSGVILPVETVRLRPTKSASP